ncbi:MAG: histidine kinase [Bacilli bacterium]|nr:histidine kinase [Bacilli bacterium]
MENNVVFNVTVCLIGVLILLVHITSILFKKARRKDENALLAFFVLTAVHFAVYFTFTMIKANYTSDAFIIGFYTTFYIFNNLEVFFFFLYVLAYMELTKKTKNILWSINVSLFAVFVLLDLLNIFLRFFFTANGGQYQRAPAMMVSQGYQFVMLASVFVIAAIDKRLQMREKIAFFSYCLLPLVAILLQNVFKGYAIAYLSIIVAIEVLFLFLNMRKNEELVNQARKRKEAEVKVMMSQIQPHFIYNTLSSISTLIQVDPAKAQTALDDFTDYLRANLSSLSDTGLITFEKEFRHIETYLSLEQMRFDERLHVVYDIQEKDFLVPPLSLQPLVENAVKHGILKKIEGGTISLKTYARDDAYVVEIKDDGIGFDIHAKPDDGRAHVGLENVRYRIQSMCHGELIVESQINHGTTVTVLFYK